MAQLGDPVARADLAFPVWRLAWSADGGDIVAVGRGVTVVEANSGQVRWTADEWFATAVATSPAGDLMAVAALSTMDLFPSGEVRRRVRIMSVTDGRVLATVDDGTTPLVFTRTAGCSR
jgi:hypothetical protein